MVTANSTWVTSFTYDAADRLTRVDYPGGRFLAYKYDTAGRRTRLTDQGGFILNYRYNDRGRLEEVTDGQGASLAAYVYDGAGRLARQTAGNGTSTDYAYDAAGRLVGTVVSSGATILQRYDWTLDVLDRPTTVTSLQGVWTYEYDAAGQLRHAVFVSSDSGGANQDLTFEYDKAGNRSRVVANGTTTIYATNALDQYTSVGGFAYTYDLNGNLRTRTNGTQTWNYTYNVLGQVTQVTTPEDIWSYEYDALGRRTAIVHDGQRTEMLIDPVGGGNVVAQYVDGNLDAHYAYGLGLSARIGAASQDAFYAFDPTGNTTLLTGAGGAVLNQYAYLPFGESLDADETVSNLFTFVGQAGVLDDDSGLYAMRARSYLPDIGRFTSPDPVGVNGGLNLYRYAFNNPIAKIDPLGLASGSPGAQQPAPNPVMVPGQGVILITDYNKSTGFDTSQYSITLGKDNQGRVVASVVTHPLGGGGLDMSQGGLVIRPGSSMQVDIGGGQSVVVSVDPNNQLDVVAGDTHELKAALNAAMKPGAPSVPVRYHRLPVLFVKNFSESAWDDLHTSDSTDSTVISAFDPNEIVGLGGVGAGHVLPSCSSDGTVKLWETGSGREIATVVHRGWIFGGWAFSPDGRMLALAAGDGPIRLWETMTGKSLGVLRAPTTEAWSLAFSPDGKALASGHRGNSYVKLWDLAAAKETANLEGHTQDSYAGVHALAFSPDGKTLASAAGVLDGRGEAKLWEVATGRNTATLKGHTKSPTAVAFGQNGNVLATASSDMTVKLASALAPKSCTRKTHDAWRSRQMAKRSSQEAVMERSSSGTLADEVVMAGISRMTYRQPAGPRSDCQQRRLAPAHVGRAAERAARGAHGDGRRPGKDVSLITYGSST